MKKYLFVVVFIFLCSTDFGQILMMNDFSKERISINLKYIHPDYEAFTVTPFSGIYDFKVNLPVSRKLDVVTSLPLIAYSRKSTKTYFYGNDGNALGNWFVGIQSRSAYEAKGYSGFIFGLYLPTSSDKDIYPLDFASTTNFFENYKYNPNQLTIYGNYSKQFIYEDGISMTVEAGPQVYIPTKKNSQSNGQLYMHYGISGSIESDRFFGTAELVGLADLTHKYEFFDYRFMHFIAFGAGFNGPVFSPTIYYQMPVDKKGWYGLPDSNFGFKILIHMM